MTTIVSDKNAFEFLAQAGPILYKNEPLNSLMIGLCEALNTTMSSPSPRFFRILRGYDTVACAVQIPPVNNLILSEMADEDIANLARHLVDHKIAVPGVVGPVRECDTFAGLWMSLKGMSIAQSVPQKLYILKKVIHPQNISGKMREAVATDHKLLAEWAFAFAKETLPIHEVGDAKHWQNFTEKVIANQFGFLWIVDSKPVAMNFVARPTKNGISVNYVYTPPLLRGRGYASAVVADSSQKMLNSGKKFCVLYTHADNPTSNKIYQNIGYTYYAESKLAVFT